MHHIVWKNLIVSLLICNLLTFIFLHSNLDVMSPGVFPIKTEEELFEALDSALLTASNSIGDNRCLSLFISLRV